MRIGIVTPTYLPYRGGVGEHVRHVADELRAAGHAVKIVTTHFGRSDEPDGPDVIRIGRAVLVPANGSMCPVALDPAMRRRMRRVLTEERFDVLHVHEPFLPMLPLAAVAESSCPVVATFHASNESPFGYRVFHRQLSNYAGRISERIAVSRAALSTVRPYFQGPYEIVPNGVDVARFASAEPFEKAPGEFRILFVGRLERRKGLEHLLSAMPDILRHVPQARLVVVGGGPLAGYYRSKVPAAAASRVEFTGFVSREDLPRHYRTADVYCSPAVGGESFGIVLLEAMAAGAPVIASDIPGYRDVVTDGVTGLLVRKGSSKVLTGAVMSIAGDREMGRRLAAAAWEEVGRYDWSSVTERILAVYRRALGIEAPDEPEERAAPLVASKSDRPS